MLRNPWGPSGARVLAAGLIRLFSLSVSHAPTSTHTHTHTHSPSLSLFEKIYVFSGVPIVTQQVGI